MTWIPVKEKLPKEHSEVLLTVRDKDTGKSYVTNAFWSHLINMDSGEIIGQPTFVYTTTEDGRVIMGDYLKDDSINIIAWMPYPQPYSEEFRVIVAGSRTFTDYPFMCDKLDKIFSKHKPTAIVCGEARGADLLGRKYAQEHGIRVDSYPADWRNNGSQAGYIRNEQMAANAEAVAVFWMHNSSGTKHMIKTAKQHGLQVRVFEC